MDMETPPHKGKSRGRPPKKHQNKLFTREMLLQAGTEVVKEKGFAAVGVDEILQRTGISRCSFYYYFKTKDIFGLELVQLYRDFISEELDRRLRDETLSPLERLRAFVAFRRAAFLRGECRSVCLMGKLAQEVNILPPEFRERITEAFVRWQEAVASGLRRAQEAGELSADVDCAQAARLFWYGWEGALQRANLERDIGPFDLFVDDFFSRLRP